jgi:short-subunit dehydrogenase
MSLKDKVVVLTGASSGIGRAAALAFAARRCRLVLAGRRLQALESVAQACHAVGGHAVVRQTDVRREEEVQALAALALAQTGVVDVWVNNAGVTLFGSLESGPLDEHRQVLETNLFGAIYGARAVLPIFRRQRRGVLINIGSVLSEIGQPFVPSYVISKFALRGLTEALRAELADEYDIHVCSLLPYAVDTEHFESAANHLGRSVHPMPPLQPPERVARALLDLAERPRRERHVPRVAVFGLALHAVLPRAVERTLFDALSRWHFAEDSKPSTDGNLDAPTKADGSLHGKRGPRLSSAALFAYGLLRVSAVEARLLLRALLAPLRSGAERTRERSELPPTSAPKRPPSSGRSLEAKVDEQHTARG